MAVRFILGRSGSGKTSYCIKAVVESLLDPASTCPLILLVPEQASFQAERAIFTDKRISGYNRLHVLSFDRLQFLLSGKNTARPELSRVGRIMAIHKILRENSKNLRLFGNSCLKVGLAAQMAQTITELQQYTEAPEQIDQFLEDLQKNNPNSLSTIKFADIDLIRKQYIKFIEGKFIDPDIQLNQLRQTVSQADFVKDAALWVDGFAGFTASELAILTELLKTASQTNIALCFDPSEIDLTNPNIEEIDPAGLFNPIHRTYADLVKIIKTNGLRLVDPVILEKPVRFLQCPQLEHIERNIFKHKVTKLPAADNIRIFSAIDKRAEAVFVAREIQRLVKTKNLRYRDIAVIASDIDSSKHYIKVCFEDYKIPFFIDRRKNFTQHPAVNIICSALQVISNGFLHNDIFAYLKNDLAPICRSDVDLLENYCIAFGVSSAEWQNDNNWNFSDPEEDFYNQQQINEIRKKAVAALLDLQRKLQDKIDATAFTRIIFDFLNHLGVREKIAEWVEQAIRQEDFATADEHRQFLSRLIDIFDELVEVFGTDKLSCADFLSIINCAFSQLTLSFIPPTIDEVLVGSIERSRHPDLKAVFLIGATQREFPTGLNYDTILTDDDRLVAQSFNLPLAGSVHQTLAQRKYLAYIAFTRPSQFLYITYPLKDDAGSDLTRSQFVDDLQSLFENLREESAADNRADITAVGSESELAELLTSGLGKDNFNIVSIDNQLRSLLNDICADEKLGALGKCVSYALDYDNAAKLDKTIIGSLFNNNRINFSATKLSMFAACPYKYFAKYILEIKPREEFKFEPLDIGDFYHRILDSVQKQLQIEKKNFANVTDLQLQRVLTDCISKHLQENKFITSFINRRKHNQYIIKSACTALENCVYAVAQMARAGQFCSIQSEVVFDELKIPVSENITLILHGKIDRLDIAETNGKKIAAVFDYKRKLKSYSWHEFYYGLDMQLAIYMLAVRQAASKFGVDDVAGAFYIPVETEINSINLDKLIEEKFGYKAKGIFNGRYFQQFDRNVSSGWSDFYNFSISKKNGQFSHYSSSSALKPEDFEKILQFTQDKICQTAKKIISGTIDVWPYKMGTEVACTYCEYKPVCRFDWQINEYNILSPIDKTGVLETIGGTNV